MKSRAIYRHFMWVINYISERACPWVSARRLTITMHHIFADLIERGVFIYLDDIIVYGKSKEEYMATR